MNDKFVHKEWQLIVDEEPLEGALNMAIDEWMFRKLTDAPQTWLRFYSWLRPTVSIGYSQNILKTVDIKFCEEKGIDVVRRMTGGKLVLHHQEVTYSLCSSDVEIFSSSLLRSYRLIAEALILGLKKMGLEPYLAASSPDFYKKSTFPCFFYPSQNEIEVKGKKLVGSAQRRVGLKFIQHGSLPLEEESCLLKSVSNLEGGEIRMASLSSALGRKVSFRWAVKNLIEGFSEFFGVKLRRREFNEKDRLEISRLKERYLSREWTFKSRLPWK